MFPNHELGGRGRPRDDARERAILDAAIEVLAEVGYDRTTMDAVAARAHASKATIYRRWPGKAELVIEALRCRVAPAKAIPDKGSLRADLIEEMSLMCANMGGIDGELLCGLIGAVRSDAALAKALDEQMFVDKEYVIATIVDRAAERGEVTRRSSALLLEVAPAMALMHQLRGKPLDGAFVTHVVDDVLLPLLRANPSRP